MKEHRSTMGRGGHESPLTYMGGVGPLGGASPIVKREYRGRLRGAPGGMTCCMDSLGREKGRGGGASVARDSLLEDVLSRRGGRARSSRPLARDPKRPSLGKEATFSTLALPGPLRAVIDRRWKRRWSAVHRSSQSAHRSTPRCGVIASAISLKPPRAAEEDNA
ncbi:hypothetical protein GQ53DRAFT_200884 [Thozetella sp. PMI_491]|nr:hypothetical protein GQ53DRAFT_200884 [Thozetella sp. PMI_491]